MLIREVKRWSRMSEEITPDERGHEGIDHYAAAWTLLDRPARATQKAEAHFGPKRPSRERCAHTQPRLASRLAARYNSGDPVGITFKQHTKPSPFAPSVLIYAPRHVFFRFTQ